MYVDGSLREDILQYVNVFRNRVASGLFNMSTASHMPTMSWDEDLASSAKILIHNCDHNGKLCSNTEKYNYVATIEMSGALKNYKNVAKDLINVLVPTWFSDLSGCRMDRKHHLRPRANG